MVELSYPIEVVQLLVSPGHAYFGRPRDGAADVPTSLVGHELVIRSGDAEVRLRAGRQAAPCAWMDRMLAPGVHAAMRGRGGVRCMPLSDGILRRGPAVLTSPVEMDPSRAGLPARRPTLP